MTDSTMAPAAASGNPLPADDAPMVEWAVWNARQGFLVIPVRAGAKSPPTIRNALASATTDEATLRALWARPGHENDNPALYPSNFVVLDFDTRDKKTCAVNDWQPSARRLGLTKDMFAETMRVQTKNGFHVYWRRPAGVEICSANGAEPFIDVRSLGGQGYLLAPGSSVSSRDQDGKGSVHRYRITNLPDAIGELPAPVVEALLARQKPKRQRCEAGAVAPGAEIDSDSALALARQIAAECSPAVEGQGGHSALLELAMRVGDIGLSAGGCVDLLLEPNGWNDRCAPPWEPEELDYQVQTMFASRASPIGCRQPTAEFAGVSVEPPPAGPGVRTGALRWFDSGDPFDVDEVSWLVDGMLPAHGTGFIGGPSQSGKTFLVYALARCLATGEQFFGQTPDERVSTFILQSESYRSGRKRLHAIDVQRGAAGPLPISILDAGGIGSEAEQRAVVDAIVIKRAEIAAKGLPRLGLLVIDTLSASRLIGLENDNDSVATAVRFLQVLADSFGCLVLVTHHPAKAATSGLRGGGAMLANVDLVIEITRDGKAAIREVECVKQRDGEQRNWGCFTLPVIEIGRRENGKRETCCYVDMSDGPAPAEQKPLTPSEQGAFELLIEIYEQDLRQGADTYLDYWKRLCADDPRVSELDKPASRKKAARRAVDGLEKKGRIAISGTGNNAKVRPIGLGLFPQAIERGF